MSMGVGGLEGPLGLQRAPEPGGRKPRGYVAQGAPPGGSESSAAPEPAGPEPEVSCGGCGQWVCAHRRLWTWTGQVIWTEDVRPGASFQSGRSSVRSGRLCQPKDPRFRSPGEGTEVPGGRCAQGPTAGSWPQPFWTPGLEGVVMTEAWPRLLVL